jgi:cytochrome c-type biogenesis protein
MAEPFLFVSTFVAGMLTFLAPCTLPILPAYLGYISGLTHKEITDPAPGNGVRVRVFKHAFAFVFGFTFVFVTFGLLAGFAGSLLSPVRGALTILGGGIVFVFGLFLLGLFRMPFLTRELRFVLPARFARGTPGTSLLLGSAFAFGWTPCIGPILGTVLYFASATETLATGAMLLLVFSIGFALPFMLLAFVIERAGEYVTRAAPYLRAISIIGGVALLVLGTRLMVGDTIVSDWFFRLFDHINVEDFLIPYL